LFSLTSVLGGYDYNYVVEKLNWYTGSTTRCQKCGVEYKKSIKDKKAKVEIVRTLDIGSGE